MGRKSKYTIEVMVNTVIEIIERKSSISIKALELELNQNTISQWLTGYERSGIEYFESRARNSTYTKEFKEMVISEYQAGGISYSKLALKYDIRSHSIIINWVRKYNRLEVIKDYDPKEEVYMSKGRKTTHEEKIEIVQYCINNNYDYKDAASEYKVSYA